MRFADAVAICRDRLQANPSIKPRTKDYYEEAAGRSSAVVADAGRDERPTHHGIWLPRLGRQILQEIQRSPSE